MSSGLFMSHENGVVNWPLLIAGCMLCLAIFTLVKSIVYNLWLSPLRDIPGPLPAKLTSFWIGTIDFAGHRANYLHTLHARYGPMVRCAPNEVSFASAAAARDIYLGVDVDLGPNPDPTTPREPFWRSKTTRAGDAEKHSGDGGGGGVIVTKTFPKSPVYDTFGKRGVFRMRDEEEHRQRLKRIGHAFSAALLPGVESIMHEEMGHLLRAMERYRGRGMDMMAWFRKLSLDIVGQLFLSTKLRTLQNDNTPEFIHYLDNAPQSQYLHRHFRPLFHLLSIMPIKSVREMIKAGRGVIDYVTKLFDDYIAVHGRNSTLRLPLTRIVAGNVEHGVAPLPDNAIVAEMMTMLFGGTDTTGTTLAHVFFELAQHPDWYARLRAELAALPASAYVPAIASAPADDGRANRAGRDTSVSGGDEEPSGFRHDALQGLPVLGAVISETLRTHPAVPTTLSRVAPKGGAPVAGRFMPAGTVVGVPAYTLQRNAEAFPAPDAWDPQRWLLPGASITASPASSSSSSSSAVTGLSGLGDAKTGIGGTDVMRAHMLVFGRGTRMCLGRAIAMMQMRLTVAAVARRFATVRLASAQTVDDMQQRDHFILMPKGHKCMLIFE